MLFILLVLILLALSFFKLPINTITNTLVMEQTNNNVACCGSITGRCSSVSRAGLTNPNTNTNK